MPKNRPSAHEQYVIEQLRMFDNRTSFALFEGSAHFRVLEKMGLLEPRVTMIRLMYGLDRGDAAFEVTEDHRLEGIPHHIHGALRGVFLPEDVLDAADAPPWEAHNLRRTRRAST